MFSLQVKWSRKHHIKLIKRMLSSDLTCFSHSAWLLLPPTQSLSCQIHSDCIWWLKLSIFSLYSPAQPNVITKMTLWWFVMPGLNWDVRCPLSSLSLMVWVMVQKRIDKINHPWRHLGLDTRLCVQAWPGSLTLSPDTEPMVHCTDGPFWNCILWRV